MIELVLVLAILAICAMIAAPGLGGFARGRILPNTATDLVTTARWCRVQALSEGVTYRLNMDVDGRRWWVTKDDGSGVNFTPVVADLGKEYTLGEGLVMETTILAVNGETYISFGPGGRTDVGTITLVVDPARATIACDTPLGTYHIVPPAGAK